MDNRRFNYLFAKIDLPPEERQMADYVFIFWNPVSSFELEKKLEDGIIRVFDAKLYSPSRFKNNEEANDHFNAVMRGLLLRQSNLVLLQYNVPLARGIADAAKVFREKYDSRWLALSFFHSDEDTLKLPKPSSERYADIIEQKVDCIMAMDEVPFVKKVEIPLDAVIKQNDIRRWFKEYIVNR